MIYLNSAALLLNFFIIPWATKRCTGLCHVRFFTYHSAVYIDKQKSSMTWQRYIEKMRKTKPLEEYFMRKNCFPVTWVLLSTRWWRYVVPHSANNINEIVETIERHSKHFYIYDYTNICIFIRYNAWVFLFLPRPHLFLTKQVIINKLYFPRPHVRPHLRPPIDLP